MYRSGIEIPKVSFTEIDFSQIDGGSYFIGFDLNNAGLLSKIDNTGTITVIEGASQNTETAAGKYRFSELPDTIIPKTVFNESTVGKLFDLELGYEGLNPYYYDTLEDGTIIVVQYNQSVLANGVMIFESYEVGEVVDGYINGWWVAYTQNPSDSTQLIKVGELQMTQQFWDNWYDWTAKDSGENVVKFITSNRPTNESINLETFITTVTYTGSGLTATDTYFDYGAETVRSLYESLTGLTPITLTPDRYEPEYILDDDYYGMAMGAEAGWYYYRNTSPDINDDAWYIIGFNLLTGATRAFNIVPALSTLTNWSFTNPGDEELAPSRLVNHPNGIFVTLGDGRICDHGDNNNGVTAIWSPYWSGANKEVIYLSHRNQDTGVRALTDGSIGFNEWYWDNIALYFITYSSNLFGDQGYILCKYDTVTAETTLYNLPFLLRDSGVTEVFVNLWANNDGMFIESTSGKFLFGGSFSTRLYQYVKHEDSTVYSFHLDPSYPTHAFDDKIININTFATYNWNTLGVPISTYKNMKF
jgi:hypothetical protein